MSDELVAEWIAKAEEDWTALLRLQAGSLSEVAGPVTFHSQQCAEKYLKALLQREDITPPRTHDLPTLLDALAATHPDLESYRPHCAFLAPFAIQSRYPGEEASAEDAREAITRLEPLHERIRKSLGLAE